ncbi:methyltransferase type 12 [Williamsia sp. 1138]|uniref:DinB family protein n=1 Tax=Williamsia sp. 1138 TaxID=1903117 RepID=UPI000A10577A|nr:DinB family protein [Williamsia sp. 1138]OZG27857.1 methyltransferase type 12 [Williamsia sp. 1138]
MAITPDTKNWTWVLDRPCPDCGFDPAIVDYRDIPRLVMENASAWPTALAGGDARLRPDDDTWSPLEYAAHVRDVFTKFTERVEQMLSQDVPEFDNWDQDATAIAERYLDQDPGDVATELTAAATRVADAFAEVPDDALGRRGLRSDGSEFTVETLALYFIHDPVHHLYDVTGERFEKN